VSHFVQRRILAKIASAAAAARCRAALGRAPHEVSAFEHLSSDPPATCSDATAINFRTSTAGNGDRELQAALEARSKA
jgi:hypothetical protein